MVQTRKTKSRRCKIFASTAHGLYAPTCIQYGALAVCAHRLPTVAYVALITKIQNTSRYIRIHWRAMAVSSAVYSASTHKRTLALVGHFTPISARARAVAGAKILKIYMFTRLKIAGRTRCAPALVPRRRHAVPREAHAVHNAAGVVDQRRRIRRTHVTPPSLHAGAVGADQALDAPASGIQAVPRRAPTPPRSTGIC